jgi:outer membrane autotransporter protein
LFLDLAFIGGYDQFDESRKIKFSSIDVGGIDRRAHTDHHGWNVDGHAGAGVIIDQWKALEIRPFISFDYLFLHEDGFKESGAKSLTLQVRHSDYSMLRSEAGVNFARCFRGNRGVLVPEVGFSVIRENRFSGRHYRSNLVGEPGSFVVSGLYPDRTLYHPAAGLTGAFCDDRLAFSLYYDGEFGHHYSDNAGTAELSWKF